MYCILGVNEKNEFGVVGKKTYLSQAAAEDHAVMVLKSQPNTHVLHIASVVSVAQRSSPPINITPFPSTAPADHHPV